MTRLALVLSAALAATACSKPPPAEAPSTPWLTYVCGDGRTLQALYPDADAARLRLAGREHLLKRAVSGSGVRYVGEGLQWWTKGEEGMLAALKPGQTIADTPGVSCFPPGRWSMEGPAPGTAGGLADDGTPLAERPASAKTAQAAATVVETYYALLESGRTAEAARLRRDGVAEDLRPYATLHAQVGAPGRMEGAAGSVFVEVPVALYGRLTSGAEYRAAGRVTLRRANDTPGATAEQLTWRIEKIEVSPDASGAPATR